jgi:hypothetical protein
VQHANINIDKLLSLWDVCGLEAAVLSFQNAIMNGADIVLPEEYVISPKKFSKKVQHKTKKQLDKIVDIDESNVELQSVLDSFTLDDINLDDFDNSNTIKFSL